MSSGVIHFNNKSKKKKKNLGRQSAGNDKLKHVASETKEQKIKEAQCFREQLPVFVLFAPLFSAAAAVQTSDNSLARASVFCVL